MQLMQKSYLACMNLNETVLLVIISDVGSTEMSGSLKDPCWPCFWLGLIICVHNLKSHCDQPSVFNLRMFERCFDALKSVFLSGPMILIIGSKACKSGRNRCRMYIFRLPCRNLIKTKKLTAARVLSNQAFNVKKNCFHTLL